MNATAHGRTLAALVARAVRAGTLLAAGVGLAAAVLSTAAPADAASCGPIRDRNGMIVGWVLCPLYDLRFQIPDYSVGYLADEVTQPALDQQLVAR